MKRTLSLLLAIASLVAAIGCASAEGDKPSAAQKVRLVNLLSMSKDEAETVLGKPKKENEEWSSETKAVSGTDSEYAPQPGTGVVRVQWVKKGNDFRPILIEVTFAKTATWKDAAKAVGLTSSNLKFKIESPGSGTIEGHGIKGCTLYFTGYEHRNRSNGSLSNEEDNGLPQLSLSKS